MSLRATKREVTQATKEARKAWLRIEELAKWGRNTERALRTFNKAAAWVLTLKRGRGEA